MQSTRLRAMCPICLITASTLRPTTVSLRQQWTASTTVPQRLLSRQVRRTPKPSSMVLSKTVARPPPPPNSTRAGSVRIPRRQLESPFGGMNQTVARLPPPRVVTRMAAANRTAESATKTTRRKKKDEPRDRDPRKALKMQRALASVSYTRRTRLKEQMAELESFDQFDLIPELKDAIYEDALRGMTDVKPSPVQRLAIPALLGPGEVRTRRQVEDTSATEDVVSSSESATVPAEKPTRREFLIAAETGSGKTLAYLLPAIHAMKLAEAQDEEIQAYKRRFDAELARQKAVGAKGKKGPGTILDEPHPTMARPRVVVLVPSAELADQVGRVAKALSHHAKFRSEIVSSRVAPKIIQRNVFSPRGLDLLIATPHLVAALAEHDPNVLARVTHLVVDEADSLLDRSFAPDTLAVLERALPSLHSLVLCSATIPQRLDKFLVQRFPNMTRITTPNLHAVPRRVQLGVLDVGGHPYSNNKDVACADALYAIGREAAQHEGMNKNEVDVRRVMVFVNEREKADNLAEFLRTKGIDALALHRDTDDKRRAEMLAAFTSAEPLKMPAQEATIATGKGGGRRALPNTKVLVATDLASRGIDTLGVRHVILYDVPHTTIDFIHRLGRAGRMGRRGRAIVLVGKDDRKDVIADVRESMYMGQALI